MEIVKKLIFCLTIAFLIVTGCSLPPKNPYDVMISADSVSIYLDGHEMEEVDDIRKYELRIASIVDTLQTLIGQVDSIKKAGRDTFARVKIELPDDAQFALVKKLFYTARYAGFQDIRFVGRSNKTTTEVPVFRAAEGGPGLNYSIFVHSRGISLTTFQSPLLKPVESRLLPARMRNQDNTVHESQLDLVPPAIFIPNTEGSAVTGLKKELDWMSGELAKVNYQGGRHFRIVCEDSVPYHKFFSVCTTLMESVLSPNKTLDKMNFEKPAQKGCFRYANGQTLSFDEFSMSVKPYDFNVNYDTAPDVPRPSRHELLGLPAILFNAIDSGKVEQIKTIAEYGFDLNSYAFLQFRHITRDWRSFTPLLLAIDLERREVVKVLLESGADKDKRSTEFKVLTVHHDYSGGKVRDVVEYKTQGRVVTPIQLAKEKKNAEIIKLLE